MQTRCKYLEESNIQIMKWVDDNEDPNVPANDNTSH